MQRVVVGDDLRVLARLVVCPGSYLDRRAGRFVGNEYLALFHAEQETFERLCFLAGQVGVLHPPSAQRSTWEADRERWQIAAADTEKGSVRLQGVDHDRTVEVGPDYLARTNPHSEAPALEHAYAVTTYSAQGSTVDRAFVMADPSMDKQELYVASSRSRGETQLYATPEVQIAREEIAPDSPHLREGIPHIAEAAERDRAQLAAHEVALRSQYSGLPTEELLVRQGEIARAAGEEERIANPRQRLEARIEELREGCAELEAQRRAEMIGHPEDSATLDRIELNERMAREMLARQEAELAEMPVPGDSARRELAVVDHVLAERRELAATAARIAPPRYIKAELGERPSDPAKQKAWDRGVSQIEGYRQRNGIKDQSRAFGQEAKAGSERARQEAARRRLREAQRALGRERQAARSLDRGMSLGIGR